MVEEGVRQGERREEGRVGSGMLCRSGGRFDGWCGWGGWTFWEGSKVEE